MVRIQNALIVSAKDERGKAIKIKYRKIGDTQLKVFNRTDSAIRMKLTVTPKEPLDNKGWYKTAQCVARALMMVRSASISYRDQYAMALPGFMPTVGDAFGQTRGTGALSPGLDFAFGLIDDDYIGKARDNNWLLMNDSVATPAVTNRTEDLQIRMTLEPFKDFKIDLTASRMQTTSREYPVYVHGVRPTTQSGSLTMTTPFIR